MYWIYQAEYKSVAGFCAHGNESFGSIKCKKNSRVAEQLVASQVVLSSVDYFFKSALHFDVNSFFNGTIKLFAANIQLFPNF
jgi:hypothetical protein